MIWSYAEQQSTVRYSTVQYSTVQYCTLQYCTVHYSTSVALGHSELQETALTDTPDKMQQILQTTKQASKQVSEWVSTQYDVEDTDWLVNWLAENSVLIGKEGIGFQCFVTLQAHSYSGNWSSNFT